MIANLSYLVPGRKTNLFFLTNDRCLGIPSFDDDPLIGRLHNEELNWKFQSFHDEEDVDEEL